MDQIKKVEQERDSALETEKQQMKQINLLKREKNASMEK